MGKTSTTAAHAKYSRHPFLLSPQDVVSELHTNIETGLAPNQVAHLLTTYGENRLQDQGGVPWYKVLLKQIFNAMILVLILAMALSYGVTDWIEGGVITVVIVLNVGIGFYQEYRAEQTMDALRSLSSPTATVVRDGTLAAIPSAHVVLGDVVHLKTGDVVPADCRLFDTMNFETDEALLTGESLPVAKDAQAVLADEILGIGDRINMAYASSTVTKGRARGIVVYTGMVTEIGKIAESLKRPDSRPPVQSKVHTHGALQCVTSAARRARATLGKILGLTVGTPLQMKLAMLAYALLVLAGVLALIVFAVNAFNVTHEVAIYAIALGIGVIPESLVAVLTITMAVGMKRMAKRKVIVRRLGALEALGGVTNVCSDKTGTLTQGRMVVHTAWIPGLGTYSVESTREANNPTSGHVIFTAAPHGEGEGEVDHNMERGKKLELAEPDLKQDREIQRTAEKAPGTPPGVEVVLGLEALLETVALCNLAHVRYNDQKRCWQATGDPTEIALQVFARRFEGHGKPELLSSGWKQLGEHPFDSDVKMMSVIFEAPNHGKAHLFTKGAVERIIELCVEVGVGHEVKPMTDRLKADILRQMDTFADQGLRVLAVARKCPDHAPQKWSEYPRDKVECDMSFLGLIGLYDPPRMESKDAVRECTDAGIRVHMLTGDHPGTARAIAREVGIIPRNAGMLPANVVEAMVKTAAEFDAMSDDQIDAMPVLPLVIARCAPQTKVRMIEALHRRGAYCAMTGDGVNDSPSLKQADVGIAMGLGGSDVAKSAADIVLTDDNFASIVSAVEEGRRMFDNIQKFILHLLITNVGEVILLVIGLAFKDEDGFSVFPLAPLEILWINMITSSFPAFGLGLEKAAADIMRRPPHDSKKGVFTWEIIVDMMVYGVLMGALSLCTFIIVVYGHGGGELGRGCNSSWNSSCEIVYRARGAVFVELTWLILIAAWEFKSLRRSMFRLNPHDTRRFPFFADMWDNKFLFWSVALGALSVVPVITIPVLNTNVFRHKSITWEWALAFGCVVVYIALMEMWKLTKTSYGLFDDSQRIHGVPISQGRFTLPWTASKERWNGQGSEGIGNGEDERRYDVV